MYVYIRSEPQLYTVGFYEPGTDRFVPESDWDNTEEAAKRVNFLNGSTDLRPIYRLFAYLAKAKISTTKAKTKLWYGILWDKSIKLMEGNIEE